MDLPKTRQEWKGSVYAMPLLVDTSDEADVKAILHVAAVVWNETYGVDAEQAEQVDCEENDGHQTNIEDILITLCRRPGRSLDTRSVRRMLGTKEPGMSHLSKTPLQTAIITGASRGLGLGVAHSLAVDHGLRVALVARDQTALDAAVDQIRAAGGEALGVVADVSDKRAIHRITGQVAAAFGDIDVLVNNASQLGPTPLRSLLDSECEDFGEVLETNLLGPFRLSKAVLGSMVLRGRGVVVQISSDAAVEAYPEWGMYGVSKAALDHLMRVWAAELEGTGVRMLSVDPGEMNTKMHADAIPNADLSTLADPFAVGRLLAAMIVDGERAPSGARLSAASWAEVAR